MKVLLRTTALALMVICPTTMLSQPAEVQGSVVMHDAVPSQVNVPSAPAPSSVPSPAPSQKSSHHKRNVLIVAGAVFVAFIIFACIQLRHS